MKTSTHATTARRIIAGAAFIATFLVVDCAYIWWRYYAPRAMEMAAMEVGQ